MPIASVASPEPTKRSKVTPIKGVEMTSRAGVKYSVEQVTPSIAEAWLGKNTANRRIRRAVVERYCRDMQSGEFVENGASICFASDGTLLDGQHRLAAVVQSDAVVWMLIVRNLPMTTQDTMDDLAKRTLADTFGFHDISNANSAAAITRRILMWQQGIRTNSGGKYQPSKSECLSAIREDSSITTAIEQASAMSSRKLVTPSIIGLTWWLFWQIDAQECSDFWQGLSSGAGLTEGSPIHLVREQITAHNSKSERVPETAYLAWIIKAWNHYRADKTLATTYRYTLKPTERFPEPR